ncbi:GIY-YIG nuclease family protein [Saccharophagus sp. K07]|jgi:putative endonuclease|uniref:GIY-YIG nuclease family protein n=1 Tax=Saccharophagus sp. K07 TaxID=2283636 RepID=UPI001651E07B|nr:GIY-YIG nuclease family protein [Saccharophagus sp. K07]MBC6906816.1 GIY-YIG nuclease family protein [Saccharophagus sp. K07]
MTQIEGISEDGVLNGSTWHVYIILTDKNHLYTGIATDIDRRFQEHMDMADGRVNARGAKFFRSQRPLEVVYRASFPDRSAALRHERLIKSLSADQKRRLIMGRL